MYKNKKGFTLLELIVVIAIIAILAAVTMWSISNYKAKNDDAVVKAGMKTITSQAEIYNLNNGGSYADMCDDPLGDPIVLAALNQIKFSALNFVPADNCVDNGQDWVVWAELKGGGVWCADARNFSGFIIPPPTGVSCE